MTLQRIQRGEYIVEELNILKSVFEVQCVEVGSEIVVRAFDKLKCLLEGFEANRFVRESLSFCSSAI